MDPTEHQLSRSGRVTGEGSDGTAGSEQEPHPWSITAGGGVAGGSQVRAVAATP